MTEHKIRIRPVASGFIDHYALELWCSDCNEVIAKADPDVELSELNEVQALHQRVKTPFQKTRLS